MSKRRLTVEIDAEATECGACSHEDGSYCELFAERLTRTADGFDTYRTEKCRAAESVSS